ncbi:minor capsid protein [Streptomyces sp. NPDC059949]|uniref:minor capsid protein n=1 Tax=Streptomyces sp. NPDC059949 TaxID=3347013 RepID=UPI00365FA28E
MDDDEPDLLEGIALYLHQRGIVTYDPTGASGNCFIEQLPSTPDLCVVLTVYDDGTEPDSLLGYDEPRLQVRTRGTTDPRTSRTLNRRIRNALHGLGPVTLPNGVELILAISLQGAPGAMGTDSNRRHEHTCNYRAQIRARTAHRT